MTGPADHRGCAETAFIDRALLPLERRVAAVRPGEGLRAVVGGEHDDGVVVHAHVLELLHGGADDVVELGHAGFVDRPAILRIAHRLILRREVGDDVHARRVEPEEERLAVGLGLVEELEGEVPDFVVHGLHPLGIERAGVFDLLLADLAPARHHGRIVDVGRPAVNHVARADLVQQLLRIVGVRRVFHGVEVIEVAEELVEAVDGGQELVEIAEVVLAELARDVAHGHRCEG